MFIMKKMSALSGVFAVALSLVIPATSSFADDPITVQTMDTNQQCIDTASQKADNAQIKENRIVWPMAKDVFNYTSPYGVRTSPITGEVGEIHTGSDFAGPDRTPLFAIAKGTVVESGPTSYAGQWVVIKHEVDGKTWSSMYGHLTAGSQVVKKGDTVLPGQIIAAEGSTGMSTGPHLHLEIWEGEVMKGKTVDPKKWLEDHKVAFASDTISEKLLTCGFSVLSSTENVQWGNHENGKIPDDKLCKLDFAENARLACDAAQQLNALNVEYKKEFKQDIPLAKSYLDTAAQTTEDPNVLAGKSYYGWGKSVQLNFESASNNFIPLISEPDYFTDAKYTWLAEHGSAFGWKNSADSTKDSSNPDAGRWVYVSGLQDAVSVPGLQRYALASIITQTWNDKDNRQCLIDLWSQGNNWNATAKSDTRNGIANLSTDYLKESGQSASYFDSPQQQITIGLNYINAKHKTPCEALNKWKTTGNY